MGAGRKTQTLKLKEKSQPLYTSNCSAPARNLRKRELGSVIFGCKNNTINECFSNLLFGLPEPHMAYVKNITPGLVLFLFNYSDRRLHGIFEAVSHGQLNIDPYAWTTDDTGYTAYGAQVRVRVRNHCHSLAEDQFRPIISDNYYEQRLFWFELDRTQTSKLMALFSSSPVNASPSLFQNTENRNNAFPPFPAPATTRHAGNGNENSVSKEDYGQPDQTSSWDTPFHRETNHWESLVGVDEAVGNQNQNFQRSYSSVVSNMTIPAPPIKWSSLFASSSASNAIQKDETLGVEDSKSILPRPNQSKMDWELPCTEPCLDTESGHPWETSVGELVAGTYNKEYEYLGSNCLNSFALTEAEDLLPQSTLDVPLLTDTRDEVECLKGADSGSSLRQSDKSNTEWGSSSSVASHLDATQASIGEDAREVKVEATEELVAGIVTELKSFDIQSTVVKLVQEIEGLKGSQLKQIIKIRELEQDLVESKAEIQQLKNQYNVLEPRSYSQVMHVEVEYEPLNGGCPRIDDSVLIVGGFDGSTWLSALDSYSPSRDQTKSLSPMASARSYASAAKLNGELYIFGGVDGDLCYDTVESYNPISDQWVGRPSLNRKKGNLAGASLHDKIYAIGGGNGVESFSEVEMFDLNVGKWIPIRSMQLKRLAPAAAEINGALYVVGGYDGKNYLNTVERFDPREHCWTGVGRMSSRRGCHSLVVLNEKLFALGGYDGLSMVSTVEIFDPRTNSWMTADPMINCRGYSGAFISGGSIYIIGGMNERQNILDTIECYKEVSGWEVTDLKAVGKRLFFSALVL